MDASRADRRGRGAAPAPVRPVAGTISDIFLARLGELERRVERELKSSAPPAGAAGEFVLDAARHLWRAGTSAAGSLASAAGLRSMLADWTAGAPVDELGLDPELAETVREVVRPLARRWFSMKETGSVALPEKGGVLVLFNRSAWPLPVEAIVLWAFLADGRIGGRRVAVMWDDDFPEQPYLGDFLRRIGVISATRDNACALLERGAVVVAFPEGRAALAKSYERRYRLARFEGRPLIEAALESGARIVPAAVVGNEESYPLLGHFANLPVTAQFPLLGPLGVLPLPVAWSLRLGACVDYASSSDEAPGVDAIADAVRARMQAMLGELVSQRGCTP